MYSHIDSIKRLGTRVILRGCVIPDMLTYFRAVSSFSSSHYSFPFIPPYLYVGVFFTFSGLLDYDQQRIILSLVIDPPPTPLFKQGCKLFFPPKPS